jgi:simple sugar transport system permease protein
MADDELLHEQLEERTVTPDAGLGSPEEPRGSAGRTTWVMDAALQVAMPFAAVFFALAVGAIIIWAAGYNAFDALSALFVGAFGGPAQIGETLMRSTPLIFTGLAVAFAFRAGLFNIGAEGQLFIGGLVVAWLGLQLGGFPMIVAMPIMLVAAALGGAAWAFIPAILKARVGAHEVITTMMFTFIARYLVSWVALGPLKAPGPIPQTPQLPPSALIPRLSDLLPFLGTGRAHFGFVIAAIVAVAVWLFYKYTVSGYELRAVGFNPDAAENGGISVAKSTVIALCASGAIAGLAGAVEIMAVQGKLFDQFSSGFGFTGIAVALLAKNNPLGVIPAAILFGALSAGSGTMELASGVSPRIIDIVQALVILFVASEGFFRVLIARREKKRTARLSAVAEGAGV